MSETVGEIAGFTIGPAGIVALRIGGKVVPKIVAPVLSRILQQGGAGAVYHVMDALVTHHDELMKMSPRDAAKTLAVQAGIGAAEFAMFGGAMEGLFRILHVVGPAAFSAVRSVRDAMHPQETALSVGAEPKPAAKPVKASQDIPDTSVPQPTAHGLASERGAVLRPDVAAKLAIDRAKQEMENIYNAAHLQVQPGRSPAHLDTSFAGEKNRLLGQKSVYALSSQSFWDHTVTPELTRLAGASKEKNSTLLRQALSLYVDRLGNPTSFDQHVQEALMQWSEFRPIVDRMNRLTDAEKTYAEQVLNPWDQMRGKYRMDQEIMEQAREFHVAHIWDRVPATPGEHRGVTAGRLNPRSQYSQERVFPTFAEGIATGNFRPRTLDIVTINKISDLDTARAVMAKGIRDALLQSGAAKWSLTSVPGWEDLGTQLRVFRHPITINGQNVEQHLYVEPNALKGIRFLYERDPFKVGTAEGEKGLFGKLLEYNGYVKSMELSYSFFHDFNLAKVFFFSRPLSSVRLANAPGLYQKWGPVAQGMDAIIGMTPALRKLVENGMVVGRDNVIDAYYAATGGQARWGLDNSFVRSRTRGLWDTLHPGLKAADGIITAQDALKKFSGMTNPKTKQPWTEDEIFEGVADVMNRKYGGLNWDRMGTTIFQKRLLRAFLLAPDWTLSNLMLGASALKGGLNPLSPGTMFSSTVEGWAARQSLAKSVAMFAAVLQGTNVLMTGHTTFQNDEGRWYSLELPWRAEDGRRLYADWLLPGELRDLLRVGVATSTGDIAAAQQFGRGKISPILREVVSMTSGTDYVGRPLKQPGMTKGEVAGAYGGEIVKNLAPSPIGLTALAEYLLGQQDLTQAAATVVGAGAVQRGTLMPATAWSSLPRTNKVEFLGTLPPDEQRNFLDQLATGKITGTEGMKFRQYHDRLARMRQQRQRTLPPDQRYLPGGRRPKREPVLVEP